MAYFVQENWIIILKSYQNKKLEQNLSHIITKLHILNESIIELATTGLWDKIPSWHRDVVTTSMLTLSQRCGTVENESCADVGFQHCDNVTLRRHQDVATTLLQRRHIVKHWISRPFYYRLFSFLSLQWNVRELQKC